MLRLVTSKNYSYAIGISVHHSHGKTMKRSRTAMDGAAFYFLTRGRPSSTLRAKKGGNRFPPFCFPRQQPLLDQPRTLVRQLATVA